MESRSWVRGVRLWPRDRRRKRSGLSKATAGGELPCRESWFREIIYLEGSSSISFSYVNVLFILGSKVQA